MAEPEADAKVDVLLALVRRRYGSRLTAAELEGVRQGIEGIVRMAGALRAVRLKNADEPYPPFVPFRPEAEGRRRDA